MEAAMWGGAMWGGAITRLQLQQTISRLRKLDELPKVPSENLAVPEVDQTHHLSISREKEIASNLVLLLITLNKNLKIIIIYIKKYYNKKEIIIRKILNNRDLLIII